MKKSDKLKATLLVIPLLASCSLDMKKIEKKAAMINHYEQVSLKLARENRELHAEVKRLEFEIEKLKQENVHTGGKGAEGEHTSGHGEVAAASEGHGGHGSAVVKTTHEVGSEHSGRNIASVAPSEAKTEGKDFVEFKTYKWHADDLLKIADKEFKDKHYEKAAQFYTSLVNHYPDNKRINDEFYFKAGIAAYESGAHHDWTLSHFESLMAKYPTSHYYRSAKLWVALTHMKLGDKKRFYATVEEFRKKYRNTNEWKILSSYYEKIEEKTNE